MTIFELFIASIIYFVMCGIGITIRIIVFDVKKREIKITIFFLFLIYIFYIAKLIFLGELKL
jgi:hypothetical protein